MSDQSEDDLDLDLDDDLYDDVLDENFEDDLDELGGMDDLEDDEIDYANTELDPESDFEEFEDLEGWDSGEAEELGAGGQKKKKHIDLSFNAMAIIGALVLGVVVLGYQIVTKKPPAAVDMFFSSLNMGGASDGPVFGDGGIEAEMLESKDDVSSEEGKGFLYEPETLNSMEMDMELDIENTPPMPVPLELDEEQSESVDILTPMPGTGSLTDLYGSKTGNDQTPRPPEDANVEQADQPIENANTVEQAAAEAEDFLKQAMKAREEKLKEEAVVKIELPTKQVDTVKEEKTPINKQQEPEKVEPAPTLKTTDIDSIAEDMGGEAMETKVEPKPVVKKEEQKSAKSEIKLTLAESVSNADMAAKLDKVLNRLNDMEAEIERIRKSGDSAQIGDISDDLDVLKKELTSINKKPAPRKAAPVVKKKQAPVKRTATT